MAKFSTLAEMVAEFGARACISKTLAAIEDCNEFIGREIKRSADLRPAHVQAMLDRYIARRAELRAELNALADLLPAFTA